MLFKNVKRKDSTTQNPLTGTLFIIFGKKSKIVLITGCIDCNYFIKEIDQNNLMSKKKKEVCTVLYYIENFITLKSISQ